MLLRELIRPLLVKTLVGPLGADVEVTGFSIDSRTVKPGDLFLALREPEMADRHQFLGEAVQNGAVAALVERPHPQLGAVQVVVPNVSIAAGVVAAHYYQYPAQKLRMIGVTGTKGKTTTTHLIQKILTRTGTPCGFVGSTGVAYGNVSQGAANTTPHAVHLQRHLSDMVTAGMKAVAMEVSSHSLLLHRVTGCDFQTGVFTNLGHDHLNLHADVTEYARSKSTLFAHLGTFPTNAAGLPQAAVINTDDPNGSLMLSACNVQAITYGIERPATLQARHVQVSPTGNRFVVDTPEGEIPLQTRLVGVFNVYNCLAALGACLVQGVPLRAAAQILAEIAGVPGRLEPVDTGNQGFTVLVDYAHTPDSLAKVLKTLRDLQPRRIITVFGCGGDRDKSKRPVMGEIAARYSNFTVITSDNPRTESPEAILDDIEAGIRQGGANAAYARVSDRREAIHLAIGMARPGDVVLIAGKGHEDYQILGHARVPFDDRLVAQEALARRPRT